MTSLTFYGGVNEIGGNKILLEDGKTKIFLDFGMSFSQASQFFAEFLQPRKCNGVLDFIEFGLLPNLEGLYRQDYEEHCRRKHIEKPLVDGILLSHAHMDHNAYIHHIRNDIPIYSTQASKDVMHALDETGSSGFCELIDMKESFKCGPKKTGGYKRLDSRDIPPKPRTFNVIDGKKFKINELEIESCPVSHSLPGATAYIIHTSKGAIVYTGDFRFHGYSGKLTDEFVKRATDSEPVVMMCEGTRIDETSQKSEEDVRNEVKKVVEKTKGLVVANFPVRDTDRMKTFFQVAKETDRCLVVNTKQAYLLKLFEESGIDAPRIGDENIRIFAQRKEWGIICDDRFPKEIRLMDYDKWEKDFLEHKNLVNYQDIRKDQQKYIFRCDFFELKNLIDITPAKGSTYIRSVCEPFSDEMLIDAKKAENWLKHFGLLPIHQIHASGHLNHDDLQKVIDEIRPKTLIPIHTIHPEMFKDLHENVVMPEKEGEYKI